MGIRLRKWTNPQTGKVREAWQVDFVFQHPDGSRERVVKLAPVNTRRGAEQYEMQLRQALLAGRYGKEKTEVPTVEEFVDRFLTYSANNNKPSTVLAKKQSLKDHILPFFGKMRLDQVSFANVEEFKALMREKASGARPRKDNPTKWAVLKRYGVETKPMKDKTINNHLAILRRLLTIALEHGVIQHVPRIKLFRTEKPPFDFLDFEEAERLIAAADPQWRLAILVAIKTGLRLGEIIGLQWNDLDLFRGKLHVRRTIWRGMAVLPKGGRARTIDIPRSLVDEFKRSRHLNTYVFCAQDGSLLTSGKFAAPLRRALRRSGISREQGIIGWHDIRHTYGSHLAMRGVPMKAIQELMGHASIEMTMRYAHLSPDLKQSMVQKLDEPYATLMQQSGPAPLNGQNQS